MDLLERMKNGEFPDGSRILRAKIDMAHPNINMRDPAMYRIIHNPPHHRTGEQVEDLPDVRLVSRTERLDGRHHPFVVFA
jgi:glutamyl/glutaminyl-tRNA synthetase